MARGRGRSLITPKNCPPRKEKSDCEGKRKVDKVVARAGRERAETVLEACTEWKRIIYRARIYRPSRES